LNFWFGDFIQANVARRMKYNCFHDSFLPGNAARCRGIPSHQFLCSLFGMASRRDAMSEYDAFEQLTPAGTLAGLYKIRRCCAWPTVASKKRILYVEYDPRTAGRRHALMVAAGYTVGVVMSSHQAVQIVGCELFDLLVLSENLPEADLERIARASHARVPQLPVLLLTAGAQMEMEALALESTSEETLLEQIKQMLKIRDAPPTF
jgi:CheY-like chemotaxis protein